ncbi:LysR family transcriptional regulator [Rheinheimera sp.]|uniref:LysR family transcriptional regulator n=1 Tax=Rheinheimera sp. TaxID=1869214 RepID=UPI00307E1B57
MNLQQLHILDAIVHSDSLQQAAQKLHKTQPALSMALKKLEQECGFALLDRSQYRLQLTAAGQRFYLQAQQVLQQSHQLKSLARHLSAGAEPSLRIAFDEAVNLSEYLPVIAAAQQAYPQTELQLSCDYRLKALEKLQTQQADLAISPWYDVFIGLGDFESVAVGRFELVCVASPELVSRLDAPLTQHTQLASLPQLVADSDTLSFDAGALLPLQSPHRVKVNNSQCMKQALLAHLGWGMVARYQVQAELESGSLVQLHPTEFPRFIGGEVHLVRHRHVLPGPVADSIWQQLATGT